jgi:hypothetical protein
MATVDLDAYIAETERRYNLPPGLGRVQLKAESGLRPDAVSPVGARGLAQFMPETAKRYGVNIADPLSSIDGWGRYMSDLLKRFDGRVDLALAGYNAGEGAVEKYGKRVPPYKETKEYVSKILNAWLPGAQAAGKAQGAPPAPGFGPTPPTLPGQAQTATERFQASPFAGARGDVPAWLAPEAQELPPETPEVPEHLRVYVGMSYEQLRPRLQALEAAGAKYLELRKVIDEWTEANAPPPPQAGPLSLVTELLERNAPAIAGGLASLAVPGLVALPALAGAGAAGLTRLVQDPTDPLAAGQEALGVGAGQAAVGAGLKGALALGSRLPAAARGVREWAAARGLPSPPVSPAGQALQAGAERVMGGAFAARKPARAMLEGLERETAAITPGVRNVQGTAEDVASFVAERVKAGESEMDAGYDALREAVGADTVIQSANAAQAAPAISTMIQQNPTLMKSKSGKALLESVQALTPEIGWDQFLTVYKGVNKLTGSAVQPVKRALLKAFDKDMAEVSQRFGQDLHELRATTNAKYKKILDELKAAGLSNKSEVTRNGKGYLSRLVADTQEMRTFWDWIGKADPVMRDKAAEGVLAVALQSASVPVAKTGGEMLNGVAFSRWVRDNGDMLQRILPPEKLAAIKSFAGWAESVYPATYRYVSPEKGEFAGRLIGGVGIAGTGFGGGGLETALLGLAASGTGAFALVRSLTSPTGTLFRLFSGLPLTAGKQATARGLGGAAGSALLGPTPPRLGPEQ